MKARILSTAAILLVLFGVVYWWLLPRISWASPNSRAAAKVAGLSAPPSLTATANPGAAQRRAAAAPPATRKRPPGCIAQLGPQLEFLADRIGFPKDRIPAIVQAIATTFEQRQQLECALAKTRTLPDGAVRISIPSYKKQGEELLADLYANLQGITGPESANSFQLNIDSLVENINEGFGAEPQEITIQPLRDGWFTISHLRFFPNPVGVGYRESTSNVTPGNLDEYSAFARFFPPDTPQLDRPTR